MRVICPAVVVSLMVVLTSGFGAGDKPFKSVPSELRVFDLTNQERKKKDVPPLVLSPALSQLARAHSENMARQGKMEHTLDEKSPFDRLRAGGYKFAKAAENIGAGADGATIEAIMQAWMDSEPHAKNILTPDYVEVGIGVARDKEGKTYYTQVFAKPRQ